MPQQIRIVFDSMPGYVPTALVALSLDDALRICDRLNARIGLDRNAWSAIAARAMSATIAMKPPIEPRQVGQDVEAEGSTAGVIRAVQREVNSAGIAAILSCNPRRNPMFDTLTPRSTTGDFKTMPCARPDPGGFLPEARTGAREAAAHMKDLAERFAELRNAIMRLPGNPSCDDRAGLRHRLLHLENTLMSARGSLDDVIIAIMDANDAATFDDPRGALPAHKSCQQNRRAMPPNSPACLDQRAREFEEGKEKGDAPKGKESSLRAASQPYQAEMQNVRSHS